MTVVVDSTVLIYLTRLGERRLLSTLFDSVLVPDAVYEEVVDRGRADGYRDALAIESAVGDGLTMVSPTDEEADTAERLRAAEGIGRGETAAIALAAARDGRCLTDDHGARTTATAVGVPVGGTIYVLLTALDAGEVTHAQYVDLIDALADSGFRMSASRYRRALQAGEELDTTH